MVTQTPQPKKYTQVLFPDTNKWYGVILYLKCNYVEIKKSNTEPHKVGLRIYIRKTVSKGLKKYKTVNKWIQILGSANRYLL